ncbi:MAG: hypothetical protein ACYC27_12525 [Armatimonadota bacterium]
MKKKLSTSTVVAVIALVVLVSALLIWKGVSTQNDKGVVKPMDALNQGQVDPAAAQQAYLKWKQTGEMPAKK